MKQTSAQTANNEVFRLMVESVQDYAIFLLDTDGYILTWNLGAERIKGYKPEEIIGRHFSAFYLPEDIQNRKPQWELDEAVKRGRIQDAGPRLRKDGSIFWANVTITALRDKEGDLRGFCKVTRDMTAEKQAQDKLRFSEERLRLLIESVQDYSIYMLDKDGNVASWNVGAERAKGYTASEIIGQHVSKFYSQEDVKSGKPQRNLDIALREGHCLDEGWRYRKDGSAFWASVVITPIKDEKGNFRGFAKITRDLTEKKRAEDELERKVQERTRELQQSNKELEQFAYVASHDLQEPLRMVATYVDLLNSRLENKLDAGERDFLRYATEGAERAQQLIRDLLEFSQIEIKGEYRKSTDLNSLLKQVLTNLKFLLDETKIKIEAGALPSMNVESSQIVQVFQNLITNAVKYRGERPAVIKISAEEKEGAWVFSFKDSGIGIAPEYHEKIFELFQRLHHKNKYPGTGLGLAICKKIVERHGGKIWVESSAGQGADFKFTLPK